MNQFIYTHIHNVAPTEENPTPEPLKLESSFNINKVIRSMTQPNGSVVILLDDFNERVHKEPDIDLKTNRMKGYKQVRETVQSEIVLTEEDGVKFFNLIKSK